MYHATSCVKFRLCMQVYVQSNLVTSKSKGPARNVRYVCYSV